MNGSRKRGLNRALADAALGQLFLQLDYKTGWYGARVVKSDKWFTRGPNSANSI